MELKFVEKTIGFIPKWIETYHLTMMTMVWSGLIILFGYLSRENINWLWLVSLMTFAQYITDLFDGKIGKLRNTGLVRWGYYMDHFLDYIFLGSILLAYSFLLPENAKTIGFIIAILVIGFVINSYLSFGATNKFKIFYFRIGPTEGRLLFILANTLIIIFGIKYFLIVLPWIAVISSLALFVIAYRTHEKIWKLDMGEKKQQGKI